ncbi:MAG: FtsX-like permease family protein [bacterium]|nr:FtsX-like permease family protein [bacterium]
MTVATFFRHLRRESRGSRGKLVFFVACLAIGVAAVVAVAGFCEGLDRGVRDEARKLLAADLDARGYHPIPTALQETIDRIDGARRTEVLEMLTLVAAGGDAPTRDPAAVRSQLVELKCVDGEYPFYGELKLDSPRRLAELLDARSAVVAPELLSRLGLRRGDRLRIGGEDFRIAASIVGEPDRIAGAFTLGPRVLLSAAGLERTGLEQLGSRILYRTLVRLPADVDVNAVAQELRALLPGDGRHRVETYRDAQPELRQGLRRMERYLGLAALLSLLIGGVGVAQTVRAWLAGRMDAIAVLKCLGYRPREVLGLYLGQAAFLGLLSSLLGILLGLAVQWVTVRLLAGVLPVEQIALWQPPALARGLVLGIGVGVLFSIPPLAAVRRVPPVRVLRRDAEPIPASRWAQGTIAGILLAGILGLAVWQAGSPVLGGLFTGALIATTAVLAAAAYALTRLAARPRRFARLWLRQGLAALTQPGGSTVSATVALGLGVLVVFSMVLVEGQLSAQLLHDLPEEAPTVFFIDVQPDQWPGVEALLRREGARSIDSVPVVMARFSAIDATPVAELADLEQAGGDEGRWALRREQRLTYLDQLPADNEIVEGALWHLGGVAEVSLEQEYADELGVGVGTVLTFDVQGVELELVVSSVRTVDWRTFGINFFLVVEPGVLDEAPQHRIAAARLPPGREQAVQDALTVAYPNVTMIQIREVLAKIAAILAQLSRGVRLLGALTVVAGLAILAGAVSAGSLRRGTEVALLKTLGMTRRQVVAGFATEYALVGLVAAVIGSVGGGVVAWLVLTRGMEIPWEFPLLRFAGAIVGTVLLAVFAGLASSGWALRRRPVEALRAVDG